VKDRLHLIENDMHVVNFGDAKVDLIAVLAEANLVELELRLAAEAEMDEIDRG
jgi:hypothetical protein